MKKSPPSSAAQRLWNLARDWPERRRQRAVARRLEALTVENLLRDVDLVALDTLRRESADAEGQSTHFWSKYLDAEHWLKLNIRYASELGLVERPPRAVLDLGCGGGYFLTVCRQLGARVLGLDLDRDEILNRLVGLFKLERVAHRVWPITKLPAMDGRTFDLITAWMICFNLPPNSPLWGPVEWDFLLADLASRLRPGGRVILSLNRQLDNGDLYSDELKQYFESMGAEINGKRLIFTRESLRATGKISVGAQPPLTRKRHRRQKQMDIPASDDSPAGLKLPR